MKCNHQWSAEPHEGLGSHYCHNCNEWEIEVNYDRALHEIEQLKDRCASYSEDVESLNGCVARLETALYEARDEAAKLREAAERSMSRCSWECSDEIYCGRCEPLVRALRFGE